MRSCAKSLLPSARNSNRSAAISTIFREKVENVAAFQKEIDHALERIAAIEKHLGINKKIAASMAELVGWLVRRIFADLVLGAHNLTEAVVILQL